MAFTRLAARVLAALFVTALPAAALAAPGVKAAYAEHSYTVAATCDPAAAVVFVNLILHNNGSGPSAPVRLTASDTINALAGDVALAPVPIGPPVPVTLPMRRVGPLAASLAGTHTVNVMVVVGDTPTAKRLPPLTVTIPATACAPAPAPAPSPAPGATGAKAPVAVGRPSVNMAIATPPVMIAGARERVNGVKVTVPVGVPFNVHSAAGGPDCGAHAGLLGAFVCPDLIKSGDLLLIWDWAPAAGPPEIDGYRVYRVDAGLKQLVYTRANKKDLTLVDVPKPAGGYNGKCYAVSAYAGARESDLSPAFCAGGGSVATTVRLSAVHARSSSKAHNSLGNAITGLTGAQYPPAHTDVMVGYAYSSREHTLGDTVINTLLRGAVAFDVSALANRKLVSARLHLQIADSKCIGCTTDSPGHVQPGNNYSCTTTIGTGAEFWWRNTSWIEGQFASNIQPNDVGPDISADVSQLVAPWLRGEPNYGFVLINRDENLGAFTNKQCQTSYTNPVLEITYY